MVQQLKMRANELEDVSVISSLCQDALVSVADLMFEKDQARFVAVINRFCWESAKEGVSEYRRTHAGLRFDYVTSAAFKGLARKKTDTILSLLTIAFAADDPKATSGAGVIMLQFADDKAIRLEVSNLALALEDLGESWTTQWLPEHEPA